jgi:hypothetical protein
MNGDPSCGNIWIAGVCWRNSQCPLTCQTNGEQMIPGMDPGNGNQLGMIMSVTLLWLKSKATVTLHLALFLNLLVANMAPTKLLNLQVMVLILFDATATRLLLCSSTRPKPCPLFQMLFFLALQSTPLLPMPQPFSFSARTCASFSVQHPDSQQTTCCSHCLYPLITRLHSSSKISPTLSALPLLLCLSLSLMFPSWLLLSGFRVRSHLSFPALVPLPFCLDSECGPISLLPAPHSSLSLSLWIPSASLLPALVPLPFSLDSECGPISLSPQSSLSLSVWIPSAVLSLFSSPFLSGFRVPLFSECGPISLLPAPHSTLSLSLWRFQGPGVEGLGESGETVTAYFYTSGSDPSP